MMPVSGTQLWPLPKVNADARMTRLQCLARKRDANPSSSGPAISGIPWQRSSVAITTSSSLIRIPLVATPSPVSTWSFSREAEQTQELLRRAEVERCDVLVAATRLDEVNIVACSIASQLGARQTICFVSKEDFLRPPGGVESLRTHFGIGHVVWPEAQLADAIERIIMAPGAIDAAAARR